MESPHEKTPQERLKENVIRGNEEFLLDLETATSIDDLIGVLQKHVYVEDGEHIVFEVGQDEEGNPDLTQSFLEEELISALITFKNDPPTDAQSIDEWFDHKDIAVALKRIYNF
jgi:hypothetical protein